MTGPRSDRPTIEVYDRQAADYTRTRPPRFTERAGSLVAATAGTIVDLGCGNGAYLDHLGPAVAGLDASTSMLDLAASTGRPLVRGDLHRLPFRPGRVDGAWARNSYLHLRHDTLPLALAELHRSLRVDAQAIVSFISGPDDHVVSDDELPGRSFYRQSDQRLVDVFEGAGFVDVALDHDQPRFVQARRARSLPDTVGPDMRLLVCGLNPSLHAADAGVGFVTPGNRFWPAMLEVGLASVDRDPWHAIRHHGVGMTDLVKRATTRADELRPGEYVDGLARLDRLCAWLEPRAIVLVGLAGWRAAVDRKATTGWQARRLGGRPTYVMPSTSGLNAHARPADFVAHLRVVGDGPPA